MKVLNPQQKLGYSRINIYSNIEFEQEFDQSFLLKFLRSEYTKKAVEKRREKTNHLPFPFVIERLKEADIQTIHKDFRSVILKIFKSYESQWDNFESNLALFSFDLKEAKKAIDNLFIEYPCFLLNIDEFDSSNSTVIHPLYNDMGCLHAYFYFMIFKTTHQQIVTLEMGLD